MIIYTRLINEIDEIYKFIHELYKEDPDLIEKYHTVNSSGINNCVDYICKNLQKDNANFYALYLYDTNDIIGFFADAITDINNETISLLASFFIRPRYRKVLTNEIWYKINSHFNNNLFIIAVVKNNIPANRFFNKKCTSNKEWFCEDLKKDVSLFVFNGV